MLKDRRQKEFGRDSSTRRSSLGFERIQHIDAELSRQPSSHISTDITECWGVLRIWLNARCMPGIQLLCAGFENKPCVSLPSVCFADGPLGNSRQSRKSEPDTERSYSVVSPKQEEGLLHDPWCIVKSSATWCTPRGGSNRSRQGESHHHRAPQPSQGHTGLQINEHAKKHALAWEQMFSSGLIKCVRTINLECWLPQVDLRSNLSRTGGKRCTHLEKQLSFIIFIPSNDAASLHSVCRKEHTANLCRS